jgi:hypothetical protein
LQARHHDGPRERHYDLNLIQPRHSYLPFFCTNSAKDPRTGSDPSSMDFR